MENVADYKEIVDVIKENGGEAFKLCYQCGLCDVVCPWNRVRTFSMRKITREATFGMTQVEGEDIWLCTSCGNCPRQCPRGVKIIESGVSLRRIATEYGVFPTSVKPIRTISASLTGEGNPLNEKRENRAKWAEGLSVKAFNEEMEILYFPGCYLSYDPRLKKVAVATASILKKANVNFGILGNKENCCGESIRKTGDEELFKRLAKENIKTFIDNGVKRVLVSSPHCYHTFKNEYPEFMVNFEVVHIAQYLAELIDAGRLGLNKEYAKKVTYHDPCHARKVQGIYQEPRNLLAPNYPMVEMSDPNRCCGFGGVTMQTEKFHFAEAAGKPKAAMIKATKAQYVSAECSACRVQLSEAMNNADVETIFKNPLELIAESLKD